MLTGAGIGFGIRFVYGLFDPYEKMPEDDDTGKQLLAFTVAGALVGFFVRQSIL